MPEALFIRDGDEYLPTRFTRGPWSADAQHGGPPAALMAGAIERAPSEEAMVLARVSIELLRPVPLEPLSVATEVIRPGRKVQLVSSVITHRGLTVASAVGLKIRRTDLEIPPGADEEEIPGRDGGRPATFFEDPGEFASEAMEIRMLDGDFAEAGPGRAWLRLRVPLIEGETTSPVERVAAAADFGNGISNLGGTDRSWVYINPDLTIRMARPPEGEWFYLDSRTEIHSTGTGLATSRLADRRGWLGVAAQSLLVERLPTG